MTMASLPAQSTLDAAAQWIKDQINAASVDLLTDAWREHLGASVIGTPCERELYYAFRWMAHEEFDGRMLRLFERGHMEEAKIIRWLNAIGIHVVEIDPETGKQWRVSGHKGHFGGSLDGLAWLNPEMFPGFPEWVLVEFKTYATGPFGNLVKQRVRKWRPKHYAQMCTYGTKRGLHLALYCAVNKNDDEFQFEFVPLDHRLGAEWEKKAARIVDSQEPPPKISLTEAFQDCKFCGAIAVCHRGAEPNKNCRSCTHSSAIDGGQWYCSKQRTVLQSDMIPKHWACWETIKAQSVLPPPPDLLQIGKL